MLTISNILFSHLILYMGDFVWHIKCIHMWSDASGNCRTIFLSDFEIFHFFMTHISNFWIFFCHSRHVIASENAEFDFNNHKINDSFSCEVASWHGRPKKVKKIKFRPKMSKIPNQPKIMSCNFLRRQTTYGWIWYAKQNPPHRGLSG